MFRYNISENSVVRKRQHEFISLGFIHLGSLGEKLRYSQSSLILLLNFGLGRGLKFSREHNFLC